LVVGAAVAAAPPAGGKVEAMRRRLFLMLVCLAGVSLSGCSYNTFTSQEEAIKAQWAEVENQLQRRTDLIPNLVETVKGFAQQEKDVFGAIADARSKMAGATTPAQKIDAANAESSALARLLVVMENYPQLKSDASFNRLMDELAGTENRLSAARMRYNERVQAYNTLRRQFPSNITASMFSFEEYPYWEVPDSAKTVPTVNFGGR
jgi:LemA protein